MSLLKRFLRRDEATESPCPRCGTPAPAGAGECAACGWDLHEAFHGVPGSHLAQPEARPEAMAGRRAPD